MEKKQHNVIPFRIEDWKGKNSFYCGGMCVSGPPESVYGAYLAHFLLLFCNVGFQVLVVPFFWEEISIWVGIMGIVIFIPTWSCLLATQFRDPGILLKGNPFEPKPEDPNQKEQKEFSIYKYRWCPTCYIWRPPKSSHCSTCDNCVKGFDHHCYFVNNCVGSRNMRFFVGFLFLCSINSLYVTAFSLGYICYLYSNYDEMFDRACDLAALFYSSLGVIIIGGLIGFFYFHQNNLCIIPFLIGLIMLFVFGVLTIRFDRGWEITALPMITFFSSVGIAPWVGGLSCAYGSYVFRGDTKKEDTVRRRESNSQEVTKSCSCSNFFKFFCGSFYPSELVEKSEVSGS